MNLAWFIPDTLNNLSHTLSSIEVSHKPHLSMSARVGSSSTDLVQRGRDSSIGQIRCEVSCDISLDVSLNPNTPIGVEPRTWSILQLKISHTFALRCISVGDLLLQTTPDNIRVDNRHHISERQFDRSSYPIRVRVTHFTSAREPFRLGSQVIQTNLKHQIGRHRLFQPTVPDLSAFGG